MNKELNEVSLTPNKPAVAIRMAVPTVFSRPLELTDRGQACADLTSFRRNIMSSVDSDFDTHVKTYRGFVRGLRYAVAAAAVTLIGLAWYLL
jgi:hypothetical protein